jgi:hypothetical protein
MAWDSPHIWEQIRKYWASDPAFSAAKLDDLRQGENAPSAQALGLQLQIRQKRDDTRFSPIKPIPEAESMVGDEVLSMFSMDNFITGLPMEVKVHEQMILTLTLASKSITNDGALE